MHQAWNFADLEPNLQTVAQTGYLGVVHGVRLGLYMLLEKSAPGGKFFQIRPIQRTQMEIKPQRFSRFQKFVKLKVASEIIYFNSFL